MQTKMNIVSDNSCMMGHVGVSENVPVSTHKTSLEWGDRVLGPFPHLYLGRFNLLQHTPVRGNDMNNVVVSTTEWRVCSSREGILNVAF